MKYTLISLLFLCIAFLSCDKEQGQVQPTDPALYAQKIKFPFNTPKAKEGSLEKIREHVEKIIKARQRNMKEELFDLTYYYIVPQYFSNVNVMNTGEEFVRHWIKFENDYTYRYGIGPDEIGSGIYHYAPSTKRLMMLDNDPQVEPKMWSLLSNSEFMNFLGHPLLVIRDQMNQEYLLMDNFANDALIEQAGKMIAEAHNGMQIKMILLESAPL